MAGTQFTPLGNIAAKNFYGIQGAGLFNFARNFNGLQAAPFNFAVNGKGVQAGTINIGGKVAYGQGGAINLVGSTEYGQGGVINIAGNAGKVQGGVINIAGSTEYVQGGVINLAGNAGKVQGGVINITGSTEYAQGGVINVAGNAGYVQGGVINVAGKVETLQGGIINVGGHVGRQVGVINISGKSDNTPIGLINIVGNGIIDATFYVDETARTGVALHMGTPYLYTLFEYILSPSFDGWSETWPQSWGFGLGTRFGMWGNFFNLDYAFLNTYESFSKHFFGVGPSHGESNRAHKARLGASYKLLPGFALSSGLTFNVLAKNGGADDLFLEPRGEYHWHWTFGDHKVRMWPGLYAGVTVGKF
jgi:hypothetical protein